MIFLCGFDKAGYFIQCENMTNIVKFNLGCLMTANFQRYEICLIFSHLHSHWKYRKLLSLLRKLNINKKEKYLGHMTKKPHDTWFYDCGH